MKIDIPAWLPPEAWADWSEFRRAKSGKGWTKRGAELGIRKLAKLRAQGHNPVEVIEQSIERGWSGLFPVKSDIKQADWREALYGHESSGGGVVRRHEVGLWAGDDSEEMADKRFTGSEANMAAPACRVLN